VSSPISQHAIACLEVWGGNESVDTQLVLPGMDAWLFSAPYEGASAGGDVHYLTNCASGRIARMMLADVSGHGAEVASVARSLRQLMHGAMNQIDQRKILSRVNQQFTELSAVGQFATAVIATFFAPTRTLTICNAGHPKPMLYRSAGQRWQVLDADVIVPGLTNIPLGILEEAGYEQFEIDLEVGDMVLCYTDALIEAVGAGGEQIGTEGLCALLGELRGATPAGFIGELLRLMRDRGLAVSDDTTAMLLRCNGTARRAKLHQRLLALPKFAMKMLGVGGPIPWPELTVGNSGGYFFNRLSSLARRRK
jgi:phosphoserine phosphatase RsbU/P